MPEERNVQKVFETEWFSIDAVHSKSPNTEPYYRLSCRDSVSIIAKTSDERIVLIRHYRPAIGVFIHELPSGYVDEGESPEDAVKRELKEETGFICESVSWMGSLRIMPSRINNTVYVFFGKDAMLAENQTEEDREVEVVLVERGELKKMIAEGKYLEVSGMAMFLLAQLRGYL